MTTSVIRPCPPLNFPTHTFTNTHSHIQLQLNALLSLKKADMCKQGLRMVTLAETSRQDNGTTSHRAHDVEMTSY